MVADFRSDGISGSLTRLTNGASYLIAGDNVTITSASQGSVTIASTTPPAVATWIDTSDMLFTTASVVIGTLTPSTGSDVNFFISGTKDLTDSTANVTLIGGDVVVSGTIKLDTAGDGTGSIDTNTAATLELKRAGTTVLRINAADADFQSHNVLTDGFGLFGNSNPFGIASQGSIRLGGAGITYGIWSTDGFTDHHLIGLHGTDGAQIGGDDLINIELHADNALQLKYQNAAWDAQDNEVRTKGGITGSFFDASNGSVLSGVVRLPHNRAIWSEDSGGTDRQVLILSSSDSVVFSNPSSNIVFNVQSSVGFNANGREFAAMLPILNNIPTFLLSPNVGNGAGNFALVGVKAADHSRAGMPLVIRPGSGSGINRPGGDLELAGGEPTGDADEGKIRFVNSSLATNYATINSSSLELNIANLSWNAGLSGDRNIDSGDVDDLVLLRDGSARLSLTGSAVKIFQGPPPGENPLDGGLLFVSESNGNLYFQGVSGTITQIALA